jgi:hypothetical protein
MAQEPPVDEAKEPPVDQGQVPPVDQVQEPPVDQAQEPPVDQGEEPPVGLLIVEASRLHSDTPHSVRLLWTSDQLDEEKPTLQNTSLTLDIHVPDKIRTHNPSKRAAADLLLRLRGHWNRRHKYYCS